MDLQQKVFGHNLHAAEVLKSCILREIAARSLTLLRSGAGNFTLRLKRCIARGAERLENIILKK